MDVGKCVGTHGGSYSQGFEFDKNQVDRILHLLVLKARCLRLDDALRIHFNNTEPAMTFFGAISLATDNLLLALMNDEVAACMNERGPTRALIESIKNAARKKEVELPKLAIDDLPDLFSNRTNFIIGSSFLDFVVGTYSAFEMFMGRIYQQLRPMYPRSGKQEKRIEKLIEKYNNTEAEEKQEALRCIIKAGGDFVSGAEKIDFVMSKLSEFYTRDITKDRGTIQFYANVRNSIHNLGKSASTKDFRHPTKGVDLTLLSGQPLFSHDYSDITRLCGDIVEIYLSVFAINANLGIETFILTE
ncbi:hypothetical protein ACFOKJ_03395 [Vogesella amnigena]|uniref:RiboL-PSP-HEPN domain-containing protein n=1 Tax=Vogesella amnigena TaxID=1507449 RepID=A0ABV7TRB3_9NEIS